MARVNRTCLICGNKYYFCTSCAEKDPQWKMLVDTEDCLKVFDGLSAYNTNKKNVDPLKEAIKGKDTTKYTKAVQKNITEALGNKVEKKKQD